MLQKFGLWLALAALMINSPRFVLLFLGVDGVMLPKSVEGTFLALSAVATGLLLTGGSAFLAHTLVAQHARRGAVKLFLTICWVLLLFFSVILLAPYMVYNLSRSYLATVLTTPFAQWAWSIVSVAAVELMAAAAMAAYALHDTEQAHLGGSGLDSLLQSIASRIGPTAPPMASHLDISGAEDMRESEGIAKEPAPSSPNHNGTGPHPAAKLSKAEAKEALLQAMREKPTATYEEHATTIGRSVGTVSNYVSELEAENKIRRHGDGRLEVLMDEAISG